MEGSSLHSDALRLLKAASRTRREIVERLVAAGHDRAAAEREAAALHHQGLIDERAVAGAAARAGLRGGESLALIERSLRARGIDDALIRAALADEHPLTDAQRALELARDLARRARAATPAARLRRVLAGLARRGYDEDTALDAARRALGAGADDGD